MRKSFILGSVAALAISGQALAEDGFSYTYLDLGYTDGEIELEGTGVDIDTSGLEVGGSLAVSERVHLIAGYSDLDLEADAIGVDGDGEVFNVGGGVNWPLGPKVDFVTRLSYVNVELEGPGGSFDDDGFSLGAGVRALVAERFELAGGLQYVDLNDSGDNTSFGIGARYELTDMFSLVGSFNFGDDATAWVLGGRINFGK